MLKYKSETGFLPGIPQTPSDSVLQILLALLVRPQKWLGN